MSDLVLHPTEGLKFKVKEIYKTNTFSKYVGTLVISSLALSIITICSPQPAQVAIQGVSVRNTITRSSIAILCKITLLINTLSTWSACYCYLGGKIKIKSCSMNEYLQLLTEEFYQIKYACLFILEGVTVTKAASSLKKKIRYTIH